MPNQKNTYRKISQWPAYFAMSFYAFLAQTRNPATFAFGFLFPIAFVSIFGLIGNSGTTLNVGIPNQTNQTNQIVQTIENQKFIKVHKGSENDLEIQLRQGRLD